MDYLLPCLKLGFQKHKKESPSPFPHQSCIVVQVCGTAWYCRFSVLEGYPANIHKLFNICLFLGVVLSRFWEPGPTVKNKVTINHIHV